jgi:hypothetical protein
LGGAGHAVLQNRYLVISGPAEDKVAQQLRDGLEVFELSSIQRLASPELNATEAVALVNATVLMAPDKFDPQFFEHLAAALRHPEPEVRRAAVFAITYLPWRQFRDLLLELERQDPTIERDVQVVIKALDEHGWR